MSKFEIRDRKERNNKLNITFKLDIVNNFIIFNIDEINTYLKQFISSYLWKQHTGTPITLEGIFNNQLKISTEFLDVNSSFSLEVILNNGESVRSSLIIITPDILDNFNTDIEFPGECSGAINGVSFTASAYSFFSDGTVWSLISNGTTISATWLDAEMLGGSDFISVNFGSFITADFGDDVSFESISSNELHIIITNPSADFSEIEEIDFNEQNDRNQTLIISENEVKFCLVPN